MRHCRSLILITLLFSSLFVCSQTEVTLSKPTSKTITNDYGLWLGYYQKFRFKKRMFYYGEYHIRRRNFAADMNKLYLRYGITYLLTKQAELTFGIATPINFAQEPVAEDQDPYFLEFRFWEQALFVLPVLTSKTYHQIRFEQRWKRKFEKDSKYKLTFRWRYKFTIYIPLNNRHLEPGTVFFSFYDEIFLQSGQSIVYNIFEDNRMFIGLGYLIRRGLQVQAGYLWNFHHNGSPYEYENENILRVALYHDVDFWSKKQR